VSLDLSCLPAIALGEPDGRQRPRGRHRHLRGDRAALPGRHALDRPARLPQVRGARLRRRGRPLRARGGRRPRGLRVRLLPRRRTAAGWALRRARSRRSGHSARPSTTGARQVASILERRGDYQGALAEIELAAASAPARPLDLSKATLRAKTGDFAGAEADLKRLLEQDPDDDELLYNIGMLYGEAKRFDEAIQYMRLALERNPDNASALNYIGYTWAEQGINSTRPIA
jgi:tetratricopeptide (TPR) repeat protein